MPPTDPDQSTAIERAEIAFLLKHGWQHDGAGRWWPPGDLEVRYSRGDAVRRQQQVNAIPWPGASPL